MPSIQLLINYLSLYKNISLNQWVAIHLVKYLKIHLQMLCNLKANSRATNCFASRTGNTTEYISFELATHNYN